MVTLLCYRTLGLNPTYLCFVPTKQPLSISHPMSQPLVVISHFFYRINFNCDT